MQLPQFAHIPSTSFAMGTAERDLSALAKAYGGTRESYREESPQHMVTLPAFAMALTPVTNGQYAAFCAATSAPPPSHWRGNQPPAELAEHPVVNVNWDDAAAFCRWLTKQAQTEHAPAARWRSLFRSAGTIYRLPTEAEWEQAARGSDGRSFPWGKWQPGMANTSESGLATTSAVGSYPQAASPYGCLDMCGNVWEWTSSLDRLYPYTPHDGREHQRAQGRRILRGGCYANPHGYARCACRFRLAPGVRNAFLGFRLAHSV